MIVISDLSKFNFLYLVIATYFLILSLFLTILILSAMSGILKKRKAGNHLKEKLYTIPVNEAYDADCECPLCYMHKQLEDKAVDYTMGSSYMEDDVRAVTDELGFCTRHLNLMYENQNRLGLALILKTHMDTSIDKIEKLSQQTTKPSSFFSKKTDEAPVVSYINGLESSCFVCKRIDNTFDRYIATIFHLYKNDENFREKSSQIKGYCTNHYGVLQQNAPKYLKGQLLDSFTKDLNKVYIDNMKRVRDDLDWFIDKFDYRFADAPWKNSKDAIQRSITKTNSIIKEN